MANDLVERLRAGSERSPVRTLGEEAAAEIERLRETNKRLNRRCQECEAALEEKIQSHPDGSFGRSLANASASKYKRETDRLTAENARLREALEFYANPEIIIGFIEDGKIVAHSDDGGKARAALKTSED